MSPDAVDREIADHCRAFQALKGVGRQRGCDGCEAGEAECWGHYCITAKKLFEKHPELRNQLWNGHLWNPSYYVGTCGDATKDVIERYVEMQKVK